MGCLRSFTPFRMTGAGRWSGVLIGSGLLMREVRQGGLLCVRHFVGEGNEEELGRRLAVGWGRVVGVRVFGCSGRTAGRNRWGLDGAREPGWVRQREAGSRPDA